MAFTDMMSSGRGPGAIGLIMALVVMIGFGILFVFAFDDDMQGGERTIQSFIAEQERQIETHEGMIRFNNERIALGESRTELVEELARVKLVIEEGEKRIAALTEGIGREARGIEEDMEELVRYREEYRTHVRNNAKGLEMEELVLANGTTYEKVSIREVTPIGIQISHSEGLGRIPYEQLPQEMIDYYQFDDEAKAMALRAERDMHRQHEDAVAAVTSANGAAAGPVQSGADMNREKAQRELVVKEQQIRAVERDIAALENEVVLAQRAAAAARAAGKIHASQEAAPRAKLAAKRRELAELRQAVLRLRSHL